MKGKVFTAPEAQAILNGSKVMFREVIKHQPRQILGEGGSTERSPFSNLFFWRSRTGSSMFNFGECPYQVGQKIFCKESWVLVQDSLDYETGGEWSVREWEGSLEEAQENLKGDARFGLKASVYYPADGEDENPSEMYDCIGIGGKLLQEKEIPWRSARSMPQWASRLTLLIKEIKVERLAEISEEDCLKEGIEKMWLQENEDFPRYTFGKHSFFEVKKVFRDWWNATHKKPEEKFEASPFVLVYQFELIK